MKMKNQSQSKKESKKRKRLKQNEGDVEKAVKKICSESQVPPISASAAEALPEEPETVEENNHLMSITEDLISLYSKIEGYDEADDHSMKAELKALTGHFNSLMDHNVDTYHSKIGLVPFPQWIKGLITLILKRTKRTSSEWYEVLKSIMRVSPTIIEPVLDEMILIATLYPARVKSGRASVSGHHEKSYLVFLKQLLVTFEKLRRMPKFVAKILKAYHDHLLKGQENVSSACSNGNLSFSSVGVLFPPEFDDVFGESISLLPYGQINDLWTSLNFNLKDYIVRKADKEGKLAMQNFFQIVIHFYCIFLKNIKIADYSVPSVTSERVSEFMKNVSIEILAPLASFILNEENDVEFIKGFFKLALSWSELHGLLHYYAKGKYKMDNSILDQDSTPFNLNVMQSYLDSDSWIKLGNKIIKLNDTELLAYLVRLVAEKLKFVTIIDYNNMKNDEDKMEIDNDQNHQHPISNELKRETILSAAQFIWSNHSHLPSTESTEMIKLVSNYIDLSDKIHLAHVVTKDLNLNNVDAEDCLANKFNSYAKPETEQEIHCAFILELIVKIVRKLGKIESMPSFSKEVSKEILSAENRATIIKQQVEENQEEMLKKKNEVFQLLLECINSLIESNSTSAAAVSTTIKSEKDLGDDQSLQTMLNFLAQQPLKDYPKDLKTSICLCSIGILIALVNQGNFSIDLVRSVSLIMAKSGHNSKGNMILFNVNWIKFFKWFSIKSEKFTDQVQCQVINLCLINIYISAKCVQDFKSEFDTLCESLSESADNFIEPALFTLDFLTQETLQAKINKSKHLPILKDHHKKLTVAVIQVLTPHSKKRDAKTIDKKLLKLIFLSCSILTRIFAQFSKYKKKFPQVPTNLIKFQKLAIKYLEDTEVDVNQQDLFIRKCAYEFLHCFYESKELLFSGESTAESSKILKLWKICLEQNDRNSQIMNEKGNLVSILPIKLIQSLFEIANTEEFEEICVSLKSEMTNQSTLEPLDIKMGTVIQLLDDLIKSKLTLDEKRAVRGGIVQDSFYALLLSNLGWTCTESCLKNIILPILSLQLKLVQNRTASRIPNTHWAVCLNSITAVPLKDIENVHLFSKAFCSSTQILNAFTIHRIDVISFRMHVYLQCFQYLLESLVKRADQENKLNDGEIFDLRSCAYSIQRCCQSMKSGRKEFSRISPYLIASVMKQLEKFTVYPAVKMPILSACYKLLDLCDDHGIAQLNSMLSYGAHEIFKNTYDIYKRFYRYRGKV